MIRLFVVSLKIKNYPLCLNATMNEGKGNNKNKSKYGLFFQCCQNFYVYNVWFVFIVFVQVQFRNFAVQIISQQDKVWQCQESAGFVADF